MNEPEKKLLVKDRYFSLRTRSEKRWGTQVSASSKTSTGIVRIDGNRVLELDDNDLLRWKAGHDFFGITAVQERYGQLLARSCSS